MRDSLEKKRLTFVRRRVKPGVVHPATPIDFIRRINDLAKKENRERDADGDREVAYEFNEIAGDSYYYYILSTTKYKVGAKCVSVGTM